MQLQSLFGDDVSNVKFKICPGSLVVFRTQLGERIWKFPHAPFISTLLLYQLIASHFLLPQGTFFLVCATGYVPCDSSMEVRWLFSEHLEHIDIEVRQEVNIRLITETDETSLHVPADITISELYRTVSASQRVSPSSFYLSPDNLHLLSSEMDDPVILFAQSNATASFYLMNARSTVKVLLCSADGEGDVPLGFSRDTPIGEMWRTLDHIFPDVVGFVFESFCTRRPVTFSSQPYSPALAESLLFLASEAGIIEIFVFPKSEAIFATICVDDEPPETVCAHPDLALCDMFYTVSLSSLSIPKSPLPPQKLC